MTLYSLHYKHAITRSRMAQQSLGDEKKQHRDIAYTKYKPDEIVVILNLESKMKYNGLFAKVIKYFPKKKRYHVSLNTTQHCQHDILVKPLNLSIIYAAKYSVKDAKGGTIRRFCRSGNCSKIDESVPLSEMTECMICRSVFYCSERCRREDQRMHSSLCALYKEFAKLEYKHIKEMDDMFQFDNVITFCDEYDTHFSYDLYFLANMKLTNKGIWQRYGMHQPCIDFVATPFGELKQAFKIEHYSNIKTEKLILPCFAESQILKCDKIISDWREWHTMRNISFKSPIAHWMSWILTVYYALTQRLQIRPNFGGVKNIVIHLIGVEVELDLLPYFKELLCLLPGYNFFFYLFGTAEEISEKYRHQQKEIIFRIGKKTEFIQFEVYKTAYEALQITKYVKQKEHRTPDIVIGLNAGVSACVYGGSWFQTLQHITKNKLPTVFTEHFCNTIKCTENLLKKHQMDGFTAKYVVNPFRSPIISFVTGSRFSRLENGFICSLN